MIYFWYLAYFLLFSNLLILSYFVFWLLEPLSHPILFLFLSVLRIDSTGIFPLLSIPRLLARSRNKWSYIEMKALMKVLKSYIYNYSVFGFESGLDFWDALWIDFITFFNFYLFGKRSSLIWAYFLFYDLISSSKMSRKAVMTSSEGLNPLLNLFISSYFFILLLLMSLSTPVS